MDAVGYALVTLRMVRVRAGGSRILPATHTCTCSAALRQLVCVEIASNKDVL